MPFKLTTTQSERNSCTIKKVTLRSAFELYQRSNIKLNLLQFPYITPDYIPESGRIIKIIRNRMEKR